MDIYLRQFDNTNDFIKFPVIPKDIKVETPQKMDTFEAVGVGDLKLIGLMGNRTLSINSFFPVKDYPFVKDKTYKGMEYVNKIQEWRNTRKPLKINISDVNVIMNCVVNNLSYAVQDGSGDIYYTLEIEEYKIPEIKKTLSSTETTKIKTNPKDTTTFNQSTYGISTSNVNIRSGKAIKYKIVGTLKKGDKIKLLNLEGDWWKVNYKNKVAYINKKYIKKV